MNLIHFLKTNANARKIFGIRELKIIEKQLLGINLTQSEKNRLSRDIRKKFEFIKDVAAFKDQFELKKGHDIQKKINEVLETIKNDRLFSRITKIVLFGSTISKQRSHRSDIDIGVTFESISSKEAFQFRSRISGNSSDDIDIQVLNELPPKIKKSVEANHKILYEQN
ncbi:MAG TPA: nucleotidyltransferase domain-containing protein [Candidatus Nanoarchaeia archaeon]|nr:nucleotidyltransferase domain-containing protein [Candidatus Nanoarchaeia archaeon]